MAGPITVADGSLVVLDPNDKALVVFDWDALHLAASVTITTSVFTIDSIIQSGGTALTKDNESIVSGSRKTQLRLLATTATVGDKYRVNNKVTTNETPAQEKERSFFVVVQNK